MGMYPPEGVGRPERGKKDPAHGDWEGSMPSRAVTEDQKTRDAWTGGRHLRSPYLTLLDLPAKVSAGDRETAAAILGRVDRALAIKGRWTSAERRRLRRLRERWGLRAEGDDIFFNVCGWEARGGYADPGMRKVTNQIDEIRKVIGL